jgi:hypothetical protein
VIGTKSLWPLISPTKCWFGPTATGPATAAAAGAEPANRAPTAATGTSHKLSFLNADLIFTALLVEMNRDRSQPHDAPRTQMPN